ncbi:hypothetical protein CAEBREN_03076 [Caenorhabditis brenneri]|uniref:Uncharacterized protein n=1 Tax=Caenorhabditis brenneri TaxID=135651 RepID=G0P2M3_CAEBE|nr:hypothetical protein CAEBREN_03076 [Caenorhabditis brenneri]
MITISSPNYFPGNLENAPRMDFADVPCFYSGSDNFGEIVHFEKCNSFCEVYQGPTSLHINRKINPIEKKTNEILIIFFCFFIDISPEEGSFQKKVYS